MSKNSYADTTTDTKVMISGLNLNLDTVAKRGLDKDFVASMKKLWI